MHRLVLVLVLICVVLLVFHPQEAAATGRRLMRRRVDHRAKGRLLTAAEINAPLPAPKGSAGADRTFRSSKRKVRRGSDPIHNRT